MKKSYLEAVVEIVSLADDVVTSSVIGSDNYSDWSSEWVNEPAWEEEK